MASTEITPGRRASSVLISSHVLGDAAQVVSNLTAPVDPLPSCYPLPEGRLTKSREAGYREANRIHGERVDAEHLAHAQRARHAAVELATLIEADPARAASSLRLLADTLGSIDGVA